MQTILPWHQENWESLLKRQQAERLPHALLFSGMAGLGKKQFAHLFAKSLLCQAVNAEGMPCNKCRACYLSNAGSHPNFLLIEPDIAGAMIKIERIRQVIDFVNETALMGGYRIIIIHPASMMNMAAANALLKTLEEPTPKVLFLLLCDQDLRLPQTIISRCQRLVFSKPTEDAAFLWLTKDTECQNKNPTIDELRLLLTLSYGAPLKAKEFLMNDVLFLRKTFYQHLIELNEKKADPLSLAAFWQERELTYLLPLLLNWLRDLLSLELTGGRAILLNEDYKTVIHNIIQQCSRKKLLQYLTDIQNIYARMQQFFNANKILLLEEILIRWTKLCS
ncbi:MAG: DNA polymerase III, delta prime subunit [uncultured bacterium]|nr:MAG: DNA polymerase III, delta prime subunit [uncultured bacterium]